MRFIIVPPNIEVEAVATNLNLLPNYAAQQTKEGKTIEFTFLVREVWTNDPVFGRDAKSVKIAARIDRRFENVKPGDEVALEEIEWELLKAAATSPSSPYMPRWMKRCVSMIEVIEDAPQDSSKSKPGAEEAKAS